MTSNERSITTSLRVDREMWDRFKAISKKIPEIKSRNQLVVLILSDWLARYSPDYEVSDDV